MTRHNEHFSDDQLRAMLDGQSADDLGDQDHLDGCPRCQDRITVIGGDPASWSELREMLQPGEWDDHDNGERESGTSGVASTKTDADYAIIRKLLGPPSHPELFGRLDRYEIERVIGSGGMGVVLKGHDAELNRPVAIKLLATHLAGNGSAKQRFSREARAAAAIVHEHVVSIFNVASDVEVPYLVMQYVDGESLQDRIDRCGPLNPEQIMRIGKQVASGLAAAHGQGVIHRDIKPANILLAGGVDRALLSDFGLARIVNDASLTRSGVIAGTPHYMSPEQASGNIAHEQSDLFSLGAVLYFMATGRPPFCGDNAIAVIDRIRRAKHRSVWRLNDEIPDALSDLIDRLLDKKPRRRPASARDVETTLGQMLTSQARRRRSRTRHRHAKWWLSFVLAVTVVTLVGLPFLRLGVDDDQSNPEQFKSGNAQFKASDNGKDHGSWKFGSLPEGTTERVDTNDHHASVMLGLKNSSRVKITIADDQRALVGTLVDRRLQAGEHQWKWDFVGADPGVHLLTIEVDGQQLSQPINVPATQSAAVRAGDGQSFSEDSPSDVVGGPVVSKKPRRGFPFSDILEQTSTLLPATETGTKDWQWPRFQRALLARGAADALISDANRVHFVVDDGVMSINGVTIEGDAARPYVKLLDEFDIRVDPTWQFWKRDQHVITIESIDDASGFTRGLAELLVELHAITDSQQPIDLEIPGRQMRLNGKRLGDSDSRRVRDLLRRYGIQPMPGKRILWNNADRSLPNGIGYLDGKGDLTAGTYWPQ